MEDKCDEKAKERAKEILCSLSGLRFIEIKKTIWELNYLLSKAEENSAFNINEVKDYLFPSCL